MTYKGYEAVIGLEVHVELKTSSKIFCSCSTTFGAEPNTQCCPVCMGYPGTLPKLNEKAVDFAIKAGLATNCEITLFSTMDRKNYFYPDLPKAYQISQFDKPLCVNGYIYIDAKYSQKPIGITRIHLEEDAGKLIHSGNGTLIDYNRCGVGLIEIVSEPDLRSAKEVDAYLKKLRAIMLYTEVSDCKMQEGSFRCDVNLSVRKIGESTLGTRTEMKNLNSFQFISKAIEYEFKRQVDELEKGGKIYQETRKFDPKSGKTILMRRKENADDYRYFPEPDLIPIVISEEKLSMLKSEIPELPDERMKKYIKNFNLSSYDAQLLVNEMEISDYFEKTAVFSKSPKIVANLITTEAFRLLPPDCTHIPIHPENLAKLADLLSENVINSSAGKRALQALWEEDKNPEIIVKELNLMQMNDREQLAGICQSIIENNQKSVTDYKNGKKQALQALLGQVMGKTQGRANPVLTSEILKEKMDEI